MAFKLSYFAKCVQTVCRFFFQLPRKKHRECLKETLRINKGRRYVYVTSGQRLHQACGMGIKQYSVDPPSCVCCSFAITLHGVRSGMEHLKPPEHLLLRVATNKAEAWRHWKMSWDLYKVASGLDQKEEKIQVATLLHVLQKECVESFSNFLWTSEGDWDKLEAVEEKFNAHCAPLTSRHFNRFLFIE